MSPNIQVRKVITEFLTGKKATSIDSVFDEINSGLKGELKNYPLKDLLKVRTIEDVAELEATSPKSMQLSYSHMLRKM